MKYPKNEYCGNENPQEAISKYLFQPLNGSLTKKVLTAIKPIFI